MDSQTSTLVAAGFTAAAAGLGPVVARIGSQRAAGQPITTEVGAEAVLLDLVIMDPDLWRRVVTLNDIDFAYPPHREIWGAVDKALRANDRKNGIDTDKVADAASQEAANNDGIVDLPPAGLNQSELSEKLEGVLAGDSANVFESLRLGELSEKLKDGDQIKALIEAGGKIVGASEDRAGFGGRNQIVGATPTSRRKPLIRPQVAASGARQVTTSLIMALAVGVSAWLVDSNPIALAALTSLVVGLTVISLVDIDTLYIDYPWYFGTIIVSWGLTVWWAFSQNEVSNVVVAAITTAAIAISFEIVVVIYRLVRGQVGLGGGDTMLLVLTVGVPAAYAGFEPALWGIIAGMALAIIVRLGGVALKRVRYDSPFAFGPFLAAGWPIGWAIYRLVGGV